MKYGLIGERLGHSFSKVIHNHLGNNEYELCEVARGNLGRFMEASDFLGINVTMPYKEEVIPYLHWIDEPAEKIGAVNTVIKRDGKLYGYNTDYYGLMDLICHAGVGVKGKRCVILGSGGTSKTAAEVLRALGAKTVLKASRSARDGGVSYDELMENHTDAQIIVNTTPVGMYPDVDGCPINVEKFKSLEGVIDAVYNPINTTLVQNARGMGVKAEGGLYMLVGQAVHAAELFSDSHIPPSAIDEVYVMTRREKENIVLIGMPASGKSTVGRILADKLGRPLIDTDELITERIGMSIKEYFALHGEEAFRKVEAEVISSLKTKSGLVISTGGGAVLKKDNVSALKYNGKIYFIDRPVDLLIPTDTRPLSSSREAIHQRYSERYPIYCAAADHRVEAECDPWEVAERISENF